MGFPLAEVPSKLRLSMNEAATLSQITSGKGIALRRAYSTDGLPDGAKAMAFAAEVAAAQ